MPQISVIVPVYNAERWLRRCVDSILAQTFTDFELLLIDDGSTDGSGAIIDAYAAADPRVRPFHKPNGGVSSARNLGLDNARAPWISFVDADDYVDPRWLEFLLDGTDGDCDIASCGFHFYKTDGSTGDVTPQKFSGCSKDYLNTILQDEMFGSMWNKLFRRSIVDRFRLRLDSRIRFREDEEFVLRYLTRCRAGRTVARALYHYFLPDWSKYSQFSNVENLLLLTASLCRSINRMSIKGSFAVTTHRTYFDMLKENVKRHPLSIFRNLSDIIRNAIYYKLVLMPVALNKQER